jgi:hypothetical protein
MSWFERVFSRRRLYGDLSEEIREHLEEKIEELVAGGMSREEAAYAARREFGPSHSPWVAANNDKTCSFSSLYRFIFLHRTIFSRLSKAS